MNSPDSIPFSQFIKIDRRKADAVYIQIVYQFIQAIQRRILEDGDKIPGSRSLSKELKVHRKTVVAALEELRMQGWVTPQPAVGTFVKNAALPPSKKRDGLRQYLPQKKACFSFHKSFILDSSDQKNQLPFRFTQGTPDYRLIKMHELGRFYSSALRRKNVIKKIPDYLPEGNPFFKAQLSYYINLTRGFHLSEANLMTTNSKEVLLYILTQLLVRRGDTILVADYSYCFSNMVFQQAGADVQTIPIDQEGIRVNFIRKNFNPGELKFVYVYPQHQFPTTFCLSERRRQELITLANAYQFIIIEDDSNYELTYEQSVNLSLLKRKYAKNVIYLGCFGEFLTPGFRANFMIAPEDFIEEAQKYLSIFGKPDMVIEQALAEMIYEGDIHRYRRKALKTYQSRRDRFAELLKIHTLQSLFFTIPKGGLAFWVVLNPGIPLADLAKKCREKGLYIPRTCLYQNREITALRLGFGHLNEQEMKEAVKIFGETYNAVIAQEEKP